MIVAEPAGSDIVCKTLSSSGTLVTVTAGRWFTGDLVLSASVAVAGITSPSVAVNGTGASPAPGTVISQISVNGLTTAPGNSSVSTEVIVKAPAGNSITIDFTAGLPGTTSATINGFIYG
jgi:hypothetical protein